MVVVICVGGVVLLLMVVGYLLVCCLDDKCVMVRFCWLVGLVECDLVVLLCCELV